MDAISRAAALRLPAHFLEGLRAPHDRALRLDIAGDALVAEDGRAYPIVGGVPVLVAAERSLFSPEDYLRGAATTMDLRPEEEAFAGHPVGRLFHRLREGALGLSACVSDFPPERALAAIAAERPGGKVLVLGAGDAALEAAAEGLDLLVSDVAIGPGTMAVLDAHDIPFADESFDAVVAVAMLEHVADPYRCVDEIERVLKPGGLVYTVTPFLQQVHMGCYDFTRFTALGHRRLLRGFDPLREGIANGPGTTLSWALEYWLTSFTDRPRLRRLLSGAARLLGWPVRWSDRFVSRREGAWDGASAFYFLGRKRAGPPPSDRQLLQAYRGLGSPRPPAG